MSTKVLIPKNPAEADLRTRDHIQKVAILLNDLILREDIVLDTTGRYTIMVTAALADGDYGDVVVSGGGTVFTLDTVPIAKGGTGQTSQTNAFDALAPTTTKGDLVVNNGTDNIRLGVGADGDVLTADSGEPSGLKWAAPAASTGGGDVLRVLDADSTIEPNYSRVVAGPYEVGAFVLTVGSGATLYVH